MARLGVLHAPTCLRRVNHMHCCFNGRRFYFVLSSERGRGLRTACVAIGQACIWVGFITAPSSVNLWSCLSCHRPRFDRHAQPLVRGRPCQLPRVPSDELMMCQGDNPPPLLLCCAVPVTVTRHPHTQSLDGCHATLPTHPAFARM